MKGIYKCKIVSHPYSGSWSWKIALILGGKIFLITPDYCRCSSKDSARRSARRIADKLNIEITFTE